MLVMLIVIYATRFCVNWAFLIAREARLKYEGSDNFKASRAIRKAQFAHKRVAYKLLLFETTSPFPKLPNLFKMISHLLLTVLTNFSRNVILNVLSRATVGYLLFFALEQLGGSLQRRKMRIYDS
jgi:Na+/H+ antiporter NhaD/arsenite permease-like protein